MAGSSSSTARFPLDNTGRTSRRHQPQNMITHNRAHHPRNPHHDQRYTHDLHDSNDPHNDYYTAHDSMTVVGSTPARVNIYETPIRNPTAAAAIGEGGGVNGVGYTEPSSVDMNQAHTQTKPAMHHHSHSTYGNSPAFVTPFPTRSSLAVRTRMNEHDAANPRDFDYSSSDMTGSGSAPEIEPSSSHETPVQYRTAPHAPSSSPFSIPPSQQRQSHAERQKLQRNGNSVPTRPAAPALQYHNHAGGDAQAQAQAQAHHARLVLEEEEETRRRYEEVNRLLGEFNVARRERYGQGEG